MTDESDNSLTFGCGLKLVLIVLAANIPLVFIDKAPPAFRLQGLCALILFGVIVLGKFVVHRFVTR